MVGGGGGGGWCMVLEVGLEKKLFSLKIVFNSKFVCTFKFDNFEGKSVGQVMEEYGFLRKIHREIGLQDNFFGWFSVWQILFQVVLDQVVPLKVNAFA